MTYQTLSQFMNLESLFQEVKRVLEPGGIFLFAEEPLLRLLEPSLRIMIDKVPQARTRIATAHRRLLEALEARDEPAAHDWMARHIRDFRKGYELAGIDLALRLTSP